MITPDPADRVWRKSSYSGSNGGACVEIRIDGDIVRIRDSKYTGDPSEQPEILVAATRWAAFLELALDPTATAAPGLPHLTRDDEGNVSLRDTRGVGLTYTPVEWAAFTAGIRDNEFAAA